MTGQMSKPQRLAGTIMLGGILAFGIYGVVVNAADGDFRYVPNGLYIEECGACHLAYPPQLLPESSWTAIMDGLEDHFGENAELDEAAGNEIMAYLSEHSLGKAKPSRMSKMMRNLPDDPPLRITEFPAFIDAHAPVKDQLELEEFSEGYLAPCADCHRQAASALFDKELLHPGYGPQVWGGGQDEKGP